MATWGEMRRAVPEIEATGRALLYQHGVGLGCLATHCCVDRSAAMTEPGWSAPGRSEAEREFVERDADPIMCWQVGGEIVVAAA